MEIAAKTSGQFDFKLKVALISSVYKDTLVTHYLL